MIEGGLIQRLSSGGGSGDVTGPASSTDNAVARFDGTDGKTIQDSVVLIADTTGDMTGVGTLASGAHTITSSSATALAVGRQGATDPVLLVNANTASVATGVSITGAAAGGGLAVAVTSSGTNEAATWNMAKGTGLATLTARNFNINGVSGSASVSLQFNGSNIAQFGSTQISLTNPSRSTNTGLIYTLTAATGQTASTETPAIDFNMATTQQHSTGALSLQRDFRIRPSTHSFSGASTLSDLRGVSIDGAPIAGTNATVTSSAALYIAGQAVGAGTAASYGLLVNPNSGATTNWGIFGFGKTGFDATNTGGGTTGDQTINKPSGTVNFAAAATSLTVTNSLCTTSSIVFAVVRTNDATAVIKNVVPGAGSFVINLNAAATAETSVGFFIIN